MKYRRTREFKKAAKDLPQEIQGKILKAFELFQNDPHHPSLGVKKIQGSDNIWEGRIDRFYRFTFEYIDDPEMGETVCWFRNVGRHDIIDHNP